MLHEINKNKIPDDVLYNIFKEFLSDKKMSDICRVNKEWSDVVNKRLMVKHLKEIIEKTQRRNEELEIDNYILKQDHTKISDLYDDLIETVETFMDLNEM